MQRNYIFAVILFAVLLSLSIFGCGQQSKTFGQPITEAKTTNIGDILSKPGEFAGKTVRVEGKITEECPSGGWFFLKDESGTIYVNLHPAYFAIPQIRGHQVIAQGTLRKEGTQIEVIGEGVQLK